jgi:putative thioredoxin
LDLEEWRKVMMASDFIINVNEADFEYEVLAFSQQVPVVVDFWAEWCGPCRVLGPLLEKLAQEGQGSFRLAKVNVDENPNLALRYGIHGIPAVKAFRNGGMVAEFAGVQPEVRVREFLQSIAPSQGDLALEKGQSLLALEQPVLAEISFREALEVSPDSTAAQLGLAKSLILQGETEESSAILSQFAASREYKAAQILLPLAQGLQALDEGQLPEDEQALDPAFQRTLKLVKRGNHEAAMDGLLDILREDKNYRNGKARLIMLALLELLGEQNPVTRQYRAELASVLF